LALPLIYHEAEKRRAWCYIPKEMGNSEEREALALALVEELRRELRVMLQTANQNLDLEEATTFFSYLESPRIFDEINEMIAALQRTASSTAIEEEDEEDITAHLLAGLEALRNVDSDEQFAEALAEHSIFSSPETPAHLRGLSKLAQEHGNNERAEYFNNLAEMLELATGHDADIDALIEALTEIAESDSEDELDRIFLAHPILSKPESIERLRQTAMETADENTAQFYSGVADMLAERQFGSLPPNLNEALQALAGANSPGEYTAVIELYPFLYSLEAIAYFQQQATMAIQVGEEDTAEFFENLAETMERIRNIKMGGDTTTMSTSSNIDEKINKN
jgi:hypothetical protein